jgi:hypothetical protein
MSTQAETFDVVIGVFSYSGPAIAHHLLRARPVGEQSTQWA